MNKYLVRIGEELLDTYEFTIAVNEVLVDLYYEFGDDDEDEEEFVDSGGVNEIRLFNEETDNNNLIIIYDER